MSVSGPYHYPLVGLIVTSDNTSCIKKLGQVLNTLPDVSLMCPNTLINAEQLLNVELLTTKGLVLLFLNLTYLELL